MKYAFFLANVDLLCVVMQLIYEGDKIYSGLFIFLSSSDDCDDVDRKSIFFLRTSESSVRRKMNFQASVS